MVYNSDEVVKNSSREFENVHRFFKVNFFSPNFHEIFYHDFVNFQKFIKFLKTGWFLKLSFSIIFQVFFKSFPHFLKSI